MRLFVYCAGGFGREVMDSVRRLNRTRNLWEDVCFIDDNSDVGASTYGADVYTFDAVVDRFDRGDCEIAIANGEPLFRKALYEKVIGHDMRLATVVDATAVISDTARIGRGVVVSPFTSVSSEAEVGDNVVLNARAIVGHDVTLGDHCVVSSLANIGGASTIGNNSYIGMGSQIKEGTLIGEDVIVGMGSVVYRDIPDGVIALGNPARPMKNNTDKIVFRGANQGVKRDQ
jgi:sugar O-acyltransferase (sialic acid O-acetyltransferase NeuD family)